jgi:hypothetical protein
MEPTESGEIRAGIDSIDLLDVLTIPTCGELVYHHLESCARAEARQTCSALRLLVGLQVGLHGPQIFRLVKQAGGVIFPLAQQVDEYVQRLDLMLSGAGDVESLLRMSARGMQPQRLDIKRNTVKHASLPSDCESAMTALLATGQLQGGLLRRVVNSSLDRLPASLLKVRRLRIQAS